MPAIVADVFGVPGATGKIPDAMGGEEASERMPDLAAGGGGLQETMAAVTRVFHESVARRDS
jgi:hypothetical protein